MFRTLRNFFRLLSAGFILARHDALVPREFDDQLPPGLRLFGRLTRIGTRTKGRRPGERLADALASQGPAYVKFGQLLATRPDIVGAQVADDLGRLQDKMPSFPMEEAEAELSRALMRPYGELFSSLSEPIAAASIAQVHQGMTTDGRKVAVKILRPGIERIAMREFQVLKLGAALAERLVPASRRLEPKQFISTLMQSSQLELDLRLEGGSASELAENLQGFDGIVIPKVDWQRTARRVLTTEWADGVPVTDRAALEEQEVDRRKLAVTAMRCFLTQALEHGFFHADMHQGNLFVDAEGRLVLVDFGIMGRLDRDARRAFAEIIYGFTSRDYQRAAKAHFDAGYVPDHFNVDAFATALRAVGEPIFGKTGEELDMSRVLQQLFDVTDVFDMHLRPELVLLQRTMVVVEGVARVLDPDIDLWETAEPIVRDYVRREVGGKAIRRQIKENGAALTGLFEHFPEFVDAAKSLANDLSAGGVSLSDETVLRLARALKGKPLDGGAPKS